MASPAKSVSVSVDKLSPSEPSLCIPFVFGNITRKRVIDALKDVGLGVIDRVDMVRRTNKKGDNGFMVYIHFKKWGTSEEACAAREMVLGGEMFQLTYDDPWFWKIGMSHAKKPKRPTFTHKKRSSAVLKTSYSASPTKKVSTSETNALSELAKLRIIVEEQRRELVALRTLYADQPPTPIYHPETPVGSPPALTEMQPPPLTRHCARQTEIDECVTSDHIARELETEFEKTA